MATLTSELADQFAESGKLEKAIRKNMKALGFELKAKNDRRTHASRRQLPTLLGVSPSDPTCLKLLRYVKTKFPMKHPA